MSTQTKKTEEEKVNVDASAQPVDNQEQTVTKKRRRGISNNTRATSRLKFNENRDANKANGLFVGHIDSIDVQWVTIGTEVTGLPSFSGLAIPLLNITFASNEKDVNVRKYVTHRMMPAESNALTIVGGKDSWKVESVLAWMKHIMDVFILKGRPMTEEEEDALTLSYEDSDENGQYVSIEAEEVINAWQALFENFVKIMNNDGKPVYNTVNGTPIPIWMKLLRFTKYKNQWQPVVRGKSTIGDLGFTNFVGEGCIELYIQDKAPMLKIDIVKESVTPKEIASSRPQNSSPMMGGVSGGSVMPQMGGVMPGLGGMDSFSQNPVFGGGNPADDLPF